MLLLSRGQHASLPEAGVSIELGSDSAHPVAAVQRGMCAGPKGFQPHKASTWVAAVQRIPSGPQVTG